ncbi:MAG: NAD(P)/FAD-dependent oxidoreductase [Planctomycetes bacterium]|nr:NAD(P)/FAD-dependent oxidoreductase [Planctomycetota bacterium]
MRRVLVLGGGFGGLAVCRELRGFRGEVTLVDRQNHHVFQPLLYQVATAGLAGSDIAQPLRTILRDQPNTTVRMGTVTAVDLGRREVLTAELAEPLRYDRLVIALGVVTGWRGRPEWSRHALALKTLADATGIRARILGAFERAECSADPGERARLMTIAVVGGGPTGVEVAGACRELARFALRGEFRTIHSGDARVLLVEAGERLLPSFSARLSEEARRALVEMGVEVRLQSLVTDMGSGWLELGGSGAAGGTEGGRRVEVETIVWAAGVQAPEVTRTLGVELDRPGRIRVLPDLSIPGHPEAFAIGDIASAVDARGVAVPALAPAAVQAARHVARVILEEEEIGPRAPELRPAFRYRDRGIMATIGRSRAVFQSGRIELGGLVAWLGWLFIHLLALVDLRSKLAVLLQWVYAYVAYRPGARIIYRRGEDGGPGGP